MGISAIKRTLLLAGALAAAAALMVACSAKSPTEPKQVPPPSAGPSSSSWAITVSASPRQLGVNSTTPSVITISVKNAANGSLPVNGSSIVVSTNLGTFDSVGGPQSVALALGNGKAQVQLYSSGKEGNATITAQLDNNVGQTVVYFGTLYITSVSPTTGSPQGGETVAINGGGFSNPLHVSFGAVPATVLSVTQRQIKVLTPPAPSGSTNSPLAVTVTLIGPNSGSATLASAFTFTLGQKPIVTAIDPTIGTATGGNTVVISGQGFVSPVDVTIGGPSGIHPTVTSVTSTEIDVTMPVVATCSNKTYTGVTVVNLGTGADNNGAEGDRGSTLTYTVQSVPVVVNSLTPSSGTDGGGTTVGVAGSGFGDQNQVLFGTQAANVTSSSSTALTVKAPVFSGQLQQQNCTASDGTQGTRNAPTSVDVQVTNLGTTCSVTVSGGFTYIPADSACHSTAAPAAPVAAFGYTFPGGSGTFQVQFTDASLNNPTQWSWDFGDGATSIQKNPVHTYTTPGTGTPPTYTVTLTVANGGGTDSISHDIVVPAP